MVLCGSLSLQLGCKLLEMMLGSSLNTSTMAQPSPQHILGALQNLGHPYKRWPWGLSSTHAGAPDTASMAAFPNGRQEVGHSGVGKPGVHCAGLDVAPWRVWIVC